MNKPGHESGWKPKSQCKPPPGAGSSVSSSSPATDQEIRMRCAEAVLAHGIFDLEEWVTPIIQARAKALYEWVASRD